MNSASKSKSSGEIPNKTSSPYADTKWPVITRSTQDALLQLLIDPIGQYKRDHVTLSKGKRSKKRKRALERDDGTSTVNEQESERPPRPSIEEHITIGLNSTTRYLEDLQNQTDGEPKGKDSSERHQSLSAIFFTHATDYLPYRHFPALVATIAKLDDSTPPILLVALPAGSEAKLSAALGIPRVGLVGVYDDAPNGTALLGYARENVPPVDDPWVPDVVKV